MFLLPRGRNTALDPANKISVLYSGMVVSLEIAAKHNASIDPQRGLEGRSGVRALAIRTQAEQNLQRKAHGEPP